MLLLRMSISKKMSSVLPVMWGWGCRWIVLHKQLNLKRFGFRTEGGDVRSLDSP